ncbi:ABC transporter substrate-binding protein [Sphaerothrix gracilis]|uniref:TRAP transporter substrate-binding protein n=1 Tax=Sphaerothrix gracilis TaxID=3151835 RepID=UPI0031FDCC44
MRRRQFTQAAAAGVASFGLAQCQQQTGSNSTPSSRSQADSPAIRWRMATSWPKTLDIMFGAAELFCRRVSIITEGQFTITPYAAGEITSGLAVLEAVAAETVECGHTSSHYYLAENPALAFSSSVPFGLTAQQQNAWLFQGGGLEAMQNLYAGFGVINFPAGNTGGQMGGWFNTEVNRLADLQGLKMRIPGLGGQIMRSLGVEVIVLAADEIVAALTNQEIEAVEWVGPYDDERLGLDQAASYYYQPGWWSPSETVDVLVNLAQWQQLPAKYQDVLRLAAAEVNLIMLSRYNAANGAALKRVIAKGTQLKSYSPEILAAANTAALEYYAQTAEANSDFRQIYQQWRKFKQEISQWNRINEFSFAEFAFEDNQLLQL